jgi:hypothetical protein
LVSPRRRARQYPAHGNQAGGSNHSHRRLHLVRGTLKRIAGLGKNGRRFDTELLERCCRVALDLVRASRHRQPVGSSGGLPMRDLSTSLKRLGLGAALGVLFGLFAFGQAAQAAYPWELNFWLSGPRYDGRVAECERALGTITSQFQEKESTFWNSSLQITAYGAIHETAFRPWQSDNIPRRYCSADVMLSDGKRHTVHYSIIEDGGFAGFGQGVEWCVTGLDRNWAYNPGCKAARP